MGKRKEARFLGKKVINRKGKNVIITQKIKRNKMEVEEIIAVIDEEGVAKFNGEPTIIPKDFFSSLLDNHNNVKIVEIEIPDSVEIIDSGAFENCKELKSVKMGKGIKIIRARAFNNTPELKDISFPKGLLEIGDSAFLGSGIEKIDLRNCQSFKKLHPLSFNSCANLKEVFLPKSFYSFSHNTFSNCDKLKEVHIAGLNNGLISNRRLWI